MAPPVVACLSKYLIGERRNAYEEWFPNWEDEITEEAFRLIYDDYFINGERYLIKWDIDDDVTFWKGNKLPWNGLTCFTVLHYVIKLHIDQEMWYVIWGLDGLAYYYRIAKRLNLEEESQQIEKKLSHLFVNFFMPMARRECFQVPKLNEVLVKDNSLNENELLASFLDFLLQILNSEEHIKLDNEEHKYGLLQRELAFLLSLLGDMPFRYTELEEVRNILGEIETLVNIAAIFIYNCVLTLHSNINDIFNEVQCAILTMVDNLNIKIKEHCVKFSKHNSVVISRRSNVMDSIFIVDSLIEDLEKMMSNQILLVNELKVEITTLHEELMISRSLIKNIRRPQDPIHINELNESSAQVRDVAYEAEYLVNSYVVGNLPLWYFELRLPIVVLKFKLIRTRLQEVKTIHDFEFLSIKKDFGREVSSHTEGTPKTHINDIVVGFEAERAKISEELCGKGKNQRIITIFGMPGIGKTTIAKKLFNDRLITDHFDERGDCVVSQTYEKRKVLIDILKSLSKSKTGKINISEMDDDNLSLKIYQYLKNRRYLIFMDDIWSPNVWDELQRFFPDDGNGSRIMLTSRIRGISPNNSIVQSLPLLTEEQSWGLLEMKVFPKESCPVQLQSIGKRIAAKCGGLPLAIVVTAGVLMNFENDQSQWEKVETDLDSYIASNGTSDYSKILELSFMNLPNHLKMCFLYIGAFPEDKTLSLKELTRWWISEGFIQREQEKSRELVAEEYLKDLINRSLVQIAYRKQDGRIKSCIIHDQLRRMCLRKSHDDTFSKSVQLTNDQDHSIYEKSRRMFEDSRISAFWGRPFGLYYRSYFGNLPHPSSRLPQMKLLRIMDLRTGFDSSYELKKVDLLVQLRYLSLNKMPKPIHENFVNLEFLVIHGSEPVYIPLVILKLVKLRHLEVQKGAIFAEDCYGYQSISRVRYFSRINIFFKNENEILRCSPHLLKLRCHYYNPTLFPDLHSHSDLQILDLHYHFYFSGELRKVHFPSTLTNIRLSDLGLPWEEISMIGRLPKLRVLKLLNHAFVGEKWETREGEFQELVFLSLTGNDTIKEWITSSDHFPQLERLVVHECINLEEIPSEISDIETMQMIIVYNCGNGAHESAVQIVETQHENGNEELRLETNNELEREVMVQFYQKRFLQMQECRLKLTFTEEGIFDMNQ